VKPGDRLSASHVRTARMDLGIEPSALAENLGAAFRKPARAGSPLTYDLLHAAPQRGR